MSDYDYKLRTCTDRIFLNKGALVGDGLVAPTSKCDMASAGGMDAFSICIAGIDSFEAI